MPIDVIPQLRFGSMAMDASEAPSTSCKKNSPRSGPRERLQAYKPSISKEQLAAYREEYDSMKDILQHVSFTEYATFKSENRMYILNEEIQNIRTRYFGFPVIQHSDHMVNFYTGMPSASHFYYVSSMLQRSIFRSYIKWDANEKHGFLNHTMMALMKLRLNIPDEELAERFGMQPYMVNMTLRIWLPGMYDCIYKNTEDVNRLPINGDYYAYTKIADIVEVCFETPEYTRRHRGDKHETRKAVVSVRNDGYFNYASSVVSVNRPDTETIKRSRLAECCFRMDMLAVHPDDLPIVRGMGIASRSMGQEARYIFKEAIDRLTEFRILMAIPTEYTTFHEYIFPVCVALSNFYLTDGEEPVDHDDFPDPQHYEQED